MCKKKRYMVALPIAPLHVPVTASPDMTPVIHTEYQPNLRVCARVCVCQHVFIIPAHVKHACVRY